MNTTHDTWSLWFGAGVVLALGIVFGFGLNEPGLIGGGVGAAVGLGAICPQDTLKNAVKVKGQF